MRKALEELTPNHSAQKRMMLTGALHSSLLHLLRLLHKEDTGLLQQMKNTTVGIVSLIVDVKITPVRADSILLNVPNPLQWNLSKEDTIRTSAIVLYMEESLIESLSK